MKIGDFNTLSGYSIEQLGRKSVRIEKTWKILLTNLNDPTFIKYSTQHQHIMHYFHTQMKYLPR